MEALQILPRLTATAFQFRVAADYTCTPLARPTGKYRRVRTARKDTTPYSYGLGIGGFHGRWLAVRCDRCSRLSNEICE